MRVAIPDRWVSLRHSPSQGTAGPLWCFHRRQALRCSDGQARRAFAARCEIDGRSPPGASVPGSTILIATCFRKSKSSPRSPRYTRAMPPCPISRRMRYAPIRFPAMAYDCADSRSLAVKESSRKLGAPSKLDSSDSISCAQRVVVTTGLAQKGASFRGVTLQGRGEQLLHLVPLFRHLSVSPGRSSRASHALVTFQLRLSVVRETPRTSADSSMLRPAEKAQLHQMGLLGIELGQPG